MGKKAKASEHRSNKIGTRASQIVEEMSRFEDDIKFIKERWADYERSGKEALDAILDMGEKLTVVRKWLDDRKDDESKELSIAWEQRCKDDLPFGRRQANRYIRIFENKGKIEFTEDEKVSVRAALEMISGSKGKGKKKIKVVAKGKGQLKSKIEVIPMRNAKGVIKGHRVRLAWCDDEIGKFLHKQGEKKVSADDSETMAGACARLFALALDDKYGDVGKRICRAIRDIPDSWRHEDTLAAIARAVESKGVTLQPSIGNGGYVELGASELMAQHQPVGNPSGGSSAQPPMAGA
ncbi:MAG: hypothetical protein IID34_09235 [Planctomycetes bacterium]|nr:hypothetical protein [Planctomycetota bacterium]